MASDRGYRVVGIGHGQWLRAEWQRWGFSTWFESDVTVEGLGRCADNPHAIVHVAGGASVPLSITNPFEDFHRTVQTTAATLEFIRTQSPETRFVYCSSASVYGLVDSIPILETSLPNPISPYGAHKFMGEQLVLSYARQYHIAASIVRLFSVYGCGLRKQLLWDACKKLCEGDAVFMGSGREVRDWLHVEDASSLLLCALGNSGPACPVVNGGSGYGTSVAAVVRELSENLKADIDVEFCGSERRGDPNCLVADISRATSWGWRPERQWQEGLAEYAAWWTQEDMITKARTRNFAPASEFFSNR